MHFNKWTIIYRLITESDRNQDCPITLDRISLNQWYCKCIRCNYNISFKAFKKSIKQTSKCPCCRTEWINNVLFLNSQKSSFQAVLQKIKMECKLLIQKQKSRFEPPIATVHLPSVNVINVIEEESVPPIKNKIPIWIGPFIFYFIFLPIVYVYFQCALQHI